MNGHTTNPSFQRQPAPQLMTMTEACAALQNTNSNAARRKLA